jgi:hypothetical protein
MDVSLLLGVIVAPRKITIHDTNPDDKDPEAARIFEYGPIEQTVPLLPPFLLTWATLSLLFGES